MQDLPTLQLPEDWHLLGVRSYTDHEVLYQLPNKKYAYVCRGNVDEEPFTDILGTDTAIDFFFQDRETDTEEESDEPCL